MRIGSLFSGYGGLDRAVQNVLGGDLAWYSEIDKHACQVLAAHHPGVPNLGDITTVDWATVPPVDILTGGYPCQPFSHAGQRKGTNDERHLWPYVRDAFVALRPMVAIFENVDGHRSLGLDVVLGDLASLGMSARWLVVRAADAGAPHGRKRVFIVVTADAAGSGRHEDVQQPGDLGATTGQGQPGDSDRHCADGLAADPISERHDGSGTAHAATGPERGRADAARPAPPVADPHRTGSQGCRVPASAVGRAGSPGAAADADAGRVDWGRYAPAIARWERVLGRPAPAPTVPGVNGRPRLSPVFVEWMMGLPDGHVTGHGLKPAACLKMLGNGVVPQQAELALRMLLADEVAA